MTEIIDTSKEIALRLEEIRAAADELPAGGNLDELVTALNRLSAWTVRTQQYVSRLQDQEEKSGVVAY